MNPVILSEKHHAIVYDADQIPEPDLRWFDTGYWEQSGAITRRARGRGNTLILATEFGRAVFRAYLRGGWPAKLSRDRYIFTGNNRSRPFREFHILRQLHELGLSVPAPLGACCQRGLLTYRGALLMREIQDVESLQGLLGATVPDALPWKRVGACIRDFHQAGLNHADLNAGNILVRHQTDEIYLVDFDRCTFAPGQYVNGQSNLARLKRSLVKRWPEAERGELQACWQALLDGYHG